MPNHALSATSTSPLDALDDKALALRAEELGEALAQARTHLAQARARKRELKAHLQKVEELQDARRVGGALAEYRATDWASVMRDAHLDTAGKHRLANRALEQLTMVRGVPSPGLRFDGYNVHTNQRVLRLSLIQGNPAFTAHVLAAFKLVLPAIEPCPIAGSTLVGKYVRVTESGLSKYGTHFLLIDESRGTYQLLVKGYGKVTVLHSAADVGALLSYVEEHCYYDSIREPA